MNATSNRLTITTRNLNFEFVKPPRFPGYVSSRHVGVTVLDRKSSRTITTTSLAIYTNRGRNPQTNLPNAQLIIYPDSGHAPMDQYHIFLSLGFKSAKREGAKPGG